MEIHDDLFARREGEVDGRCRQVLHVEVGRRRHSFLSVHSFSTRVITICHRPGGASVPCTGGHVLVPRVIQALVP
jgi:hypothetical protein